MGVPAKIRAPEGIATPAMEAVLRHVQTPGISRLKCLMESIMPAKRARFVRALGQQIRVAILCGLAYRATSRFGGILGSAVGSEGDQTNPP